MSRTLPMLTAVLLSLLFVAFAACGGDDEEGTGTPTTPSGAGATQTAATGTAAGATETAATATAATATEAAGATPTVPSFSGGATATVTVGDETFTFENGKCDVAPDETWLAVNIGQAGSEYFGLLVGSNEAAPAGARPVTGGGVFTDGEITLTVEHGGTSFLLGGIGAAAAANKVTLAADLSSGEFEGNTLDGLPISGSFQC